MGFGSLNSQQRVMVLLELLGGPKFAAEMKGAAVSTGLLGKNVDTMGKQMEKSARRTFLQNQALYTLRRYAFYGTIAVTAMGVAVVKLGYNYLSAMQQARVALSPVIKDHAVLEGYLNRLFKIAKYSPFVITDLAVSFRQLFAGLHPAGISAPKIITLMQALTDFMSASGKTSPGQMQRVALAIQHLAYAGRVTGYAANQLGRLGIPVSPILRSFGITDVRNLSAQNISANSFINAIIGYSGTGQFRNAARRQALRTLPGLIQVARDSISQIAGRLIQGGYGGSQGLMSRLFAPGGSFDKIGNQTTGRGTLFALNKSITGGTGLAKGLLLLLSIARNLGAVFAHVIVPAWIMGLHALIIFYPVLKGINWALGMLAKHGTVAKWVFAFLAAEFVITHFALLGLWTATKLYNIATLGSIRPIQTAIRFLGYYISAIGGSTGLTSSINLAILRLRALRLGLLKMAGLTISAVVLLSLIPRAKKNPNPNAPSNNPIQRGLTHIPLLGPAFSQVGAAADWLGNLTGLSSSNTTASATSGWAQGDPRSRRYITAASGNGMQMPVSGLAGAEGIVVHSQLIVDRKVLAESVARAKADKASTR